MYMSPCKDRSRSVLLSSRIASEAVVVIYHTPAFQSEACRFTGGCDLYLSPPAKYLDKEFTFFTFIHR
jgi:uncharacterized protein (UPF0179 family)